MIIQAHERVALEAAAERLADECALRLQSVGRYAILVVGVCIGLAWFYNVKVTDKSDNEQAALVSIAASVVFLACMQIGMLLTSRRELKLVLTG